MSQQVEHLTEIRDEACLLLALQDMGFSLEEIETHGIPQPVVGYDSLARMDKSGEVIRAQVIIRRKHVGGMANDIGFRKEKNGTYSVHISEYDERATGKHGPYNQDWRDRLAQNYATHVTERAYRRKGWSITRTLTQDEQGKPLVLLTARR